MRWAPEGPVVVTVLSPSVAKRPGHGGGTSVSERPVGEVWLGLAAWPVVAGRFTAGPGGGSP